jgi:lipopolysaccharide transport system ATP-binding protein
MSEVAIRVEGLGKKYSIGSYKAGDLRNAFGNFLKKYNLFSVHHRSTSHNQHKKEFWALKEINFEVKKGEAMGIIGRNGAGKSTLLRILSRITEPTTGFYTLKGRVSSLLEVGTGFHMELTGRENIYLNGTILGMKRREIREKFNEIVEFSGVEQFIDTPVKHYSSGMKVRLAFSVAAHLEPEILIIDEVLAVGDAEFQKKCLGKMEDVTGQGRTVLFVSHNLVAVNQLCQMGLLLVNGELYYNGIVSEAIHKYITSIKIEAAGNKLINVENRKGNGKFRVEDIKLLNEKFEPINIARTGASLIFEIRFNRIISQNEGYFRVDFAIDTEQNMRIGWFSSDAVERKLSGEFKIIHLKIPRLILGEGDYYFTFYATLNGIVVDYIPQGYSFTVEEGDFFGTGMIIPKSQTFIYSDHQIYSYL